MPWEDLEGDIADEFGDYTYRQAEVDGRMEDFRARGLARAERKRDEMRRRRGSTPLSIARRRRIYATDYEQVELPEMTKILKGEEAKKAARLAEGGAGQAPIQRRPPEVIHVAGGLSDDPICGAEPKGAYVVDQERASRATCEKCAGLRGGEGVPTMRCYPAGEGPASDAFVATATDTIRRGMESKLAEIAYQQLHDAAKDYAKLLGEKWIVDVEPYGPAMNGRSGIRITIVGGR